MEFTRANTFCIYCRELVEDDGTSRGDFAREHLLANGIDATMIEGIHGKSFGLATTKEYGLDGNNEWRISSGHIGLILSHYMVWTHIWASGLPYAMVFEDDANIGPDFAPGLQRVIKDLESRPRWEIVYLGWLDTHEREQESKGDILCRLNDVPFGTHAMLLSGRGARRLLDSNRMCWAHIDVQIYQTTLRQNACAWFATKKSICRQRSQETIDGAKWRPSV